MLICVAVPLRSRAVGDSGGGAATSASQRDKLQGALDKAQATSSRIGEAKRTILETEELGVSILQDLHKQRNTIVNAREKLHGADENISVARKVLSNMGKRAMQNKIMMGAIILLLLGAIILIIAIKLN